MVADGAGTALGVDVAPATPAEVKLLERHLTMDVLADAAQHAAGLSA